MRAFYLSPVGFEVGLTSIALGLVRALERQGLKVGFMKTIAQPLPFELGPERSTHFANKLFHLSPPTPIDFGRAEHLIGSGQTDQLMEEILGLYQQVSESSDVVVIEGMSADSKHVYAPELNAHIARNLEAETIFVGSAAHSSLEDIAKQIEVAARQSTNAHNTRFAGFIISKVPEAIVPTDYTLTLSQLTPTAKARRLSLIGTVPFASAFAAPRTLDVANHLGALVLCNTRLAHARAVDMVVAARSARFMVSRLKAGALVIAPGDRDDVILATAMAAHRGVPLAGLLLTCNALPDPHIYHITQLDDKAPLPILITPLDTFATASRLAQMHNHVPADDVARMEQVVDFVAEHLDVTRLIQKIGQPHEVHMPPPAFRYQLMTRARRANKRIVLPEGEEPRTIQAAAICHQKGIARCVLIGKADVIRKTAATLDIALPDDLDILDPDVIRSRYVAPLVQARHSKGLTESQAEVALEDTVVLGTMMLALDEVDGLVSGAIHTTANTVRPALQLIKTAPGASIVSSIFFMLMPDQVLVYGDCAVNPDPTAEELADIAIQSADSARAFGLEPRVAMISYSTGSSGSGSDVEKVRKATAMVKAARPDILVDGPMQYDAASVESVGQQKAPDSLVAGRANVFVFPDLNTGNTTYKAVQRSANVVSVGPMLQGLRKPVNDLSRGALVDDIVYTIALTAIQSEQMASVAAALAATEAGETVVSDALADAPA